MKKKTIITSLALLAAAAMVGVGASVGMTASRSPEAANALPLNSEGYFEINTVDDLHQFFDGGAGNNQAKAKLMTDLDLGGETISHEGSHGMAGDFQAIFDGQGHTLHNVGFTDQWGLWNNIGDKGVIQNLTVEFHAIGDSLSVVRPFTYLNNGSISNVRVVIDAAGSTLNEVGPLAYVGSSGTYYNCDVNYIVKSGAFMGKAVHEGIGADSEQLSGTEYTFTSTEGKSESEYPNLWRNDGGNIPNPEDLEYIYAPDPSITLNTVEPKFVALYEFGGDSSADINWTAEDDIVTVEDSEGGIMLTGKSTGSTVVTGTYNDVSISLNVTVEDASPVTGVDLTSSVTKLAIDETGTLEAIIEGNNYDSIEWDVSDPESLSIEPDGTTATIKALKESEAPVTVTVKVIAGEAEFTDTIDIEVTPKVTFNINYLIEDSGANDRVLSQNPIHLFKDASPALKSYTPTIWEPTSGDKVTIEIDGVDYIIARITVGVSEANLKDGQNIFCEYAFPVGSFGKLDITDSVKGSDDAWKDVSILVNVDGHTNIKEDGTSEIIIDRQESKVFTNDENYYINEAIDFAYDVVSPNWRDTNGSMCHFLDNPDESEALTNITNAYTDDLSSEAKKVLDTISGGDGTSIGQSVQYLINNSKVAKDGNRVSVINANKSLGTTAIVAIAITTGAAALGLVYLALRKKSKKAE